MEETKQSTIIEPTPRLLSTIATHTRTQRNSNWLERGRVSTNCQHASSCGTDVLSSCRQVHWCKYPIRVNTRLGEVLSKADIRAGAKTMLAQVTHQRFPIARNGKFRAPPNPKNIAILVQQHAPVGQSAHACEINQVSQKSRRMKTAGLIPDLAVSNRLPALTPTR